MRVKRTLVIEMPKVKRCRTNLIDVQNDVVSCSVRNKGSELHSVGLFAVPITELEGLSNVGSSRGSIRWKKEEDESNSQMQDVYIGVDDGIFRKNGSLPPLLKSSRGRAQALPARFKDSVLHSWKKEKIDAFDESENECSTSGLDSDGVGKSVVVRKGQGVARNGLKSGRVYGNSGNAQMNKKHGVDDGFSSLVQYGNDVVPYYGDVGHCDLGYAGNKDSDMIETVENNLYSAKFSNESFEVQEKCVKVEDKKSDFYQPSDFMMGDIVWAKCGKRFPAWPAIVIDPLWQAPESVLRACVPDTLCVMFYGFAKSGLREYSWIKAGMVFPFQEYFDRFQGQTNLYGSKPRDFHMAIEEAVLAEEGISNTGNSLTSTQSEEEVPGSDQNQICQKKDSRTCESCELVLPNRLLKKWRSISGEVQFFCEHCIKLRKSKQYCGICNEIWHHSDGGDWVCCDGCNVWVHAECVDVSYELFKKLGNSNYFCPECKERSKSGTDKCQAKIRSAGCNWSTELPEKVAVVCADMEGIYYPSLHLVQCTCGSCGTKKQKLNKWERHTGCRAKKWKSTVKLKGSDLTLVEWLAQIYEHGCDPLQFEKQRIISLLKENYKAVKVKWTSERCAICRWVEDWDYNKIIICTRCEIAVHEECYGSRDVKDFATWVCRACETPEVQECCLCPVKGKPIEPNVDSFSNIAAIVHTSYLVLICSFFL
ncbi:zinc finger transcription factor [Lithospermum erythrorhizon]|uniref:Zinc finger transcription factor n=1 Tax=Lithospermum erythrorhizon TaxID=34254 RepID=A0AAV3Q746_LITER